MYGLGKGVLLLVSLVAAIRAGHVLCMIFGGILAVTLFGRSGAMVMTAAGTRRVFLDVRAGSADGH